MRIFDVERMTAETKIKLSLNLDGSGQNEISTGCGFLDHMLTLFSHHSRFDLSLDCKGDTYIDDHHSVEDIGICLGQAFLNALGELKGINRYAHILLPMDEALIMCCIDISGRAFLNYDVDVKNPKIGTYDTELTQEFLLAFVRNAKITLHIKQLSGTNAHHITEGIFKALGRTLSEAVAINEKFKNEIPSSKGSI